MAFEDLDLEFEDEEEAKKKKNDAMAVDVDLEFHTSTSVKKPPPREAAARPVAPVGPRPVIQTGNGPGVAASATVRPITSARPAAPPQRGTAAAAPKMVGTSALKEDLDDLESMEVMEMREKLRLTEFNAEVRVAIAEYKTEHLSELLSDMKLMDHQINQLLVRINAKHPDLKQEVLMIKKLLADFTAKKRK